MRPIVKTAMVAGVAGVMALASMNASEARNRGWVGAGIGLAVGAAIAGAAANSYYGYGPGYYGYGPAYAYEPYYAPAPVYAAPVYAAPVYTAPVYAAPAYTYSPGYDSYAYAPGYSYGGYNTNYTGPWRERHLQGRD